MNYPDFLDNLSTCKSPQQMFDTTQAVFSQDKELESIGLQVPQITKIMSILKADGYPVHTCLTLEEAMEQLLPLLPRKGGTSE